MSKDLDQKEMDQMTAAEEDGHKFIKLILNKSRVSRGQKEVRIAGVKCLKCYSRGKNDEGIEEWDFVTSSGQIKFKLNRRERAYIGYLWDDKEPAIYHQKGYNRDFLATHLATRDFTIVDEAIRNDIVKREIKIAKKIQEQKEQKQKQVVQSVNPKDDIKDLEKQMEFLASKKEALEEKLQAEKPKKRSATRRTSRKSESATNEATPPPIDATPEKEDEVPSVVTADTKTELTEA